MYYLFKNDPIVNPSNYQGNSFRDGNYWYKVFTDLKEFDSECKMLEAIYSCPGTVKLFDYGGLVKKDSNTQINYYAIKEEYVDGQTFEDYSNMSHDEESIIRLFVRLVSVLSDLESRGIIQNDLKPSNIIIKDDGNPVLIDFGISKRLDEKMSEIHTHISGNFSAPEKKEGKTPNVRSDIFSVGQLIKFYMDRNGGAQTYSKAFNNVREKCSKHSPDERYRTFAEVKKALREIQESKVTHKETIIKTRQKLSQTVDMILIGVMPFVKFMLDATCIFFLLLGSYMIFRPEDKEPLRTHADNPNLREDLKIVFTDIHNSFNED